MKLQVMAKARDPQDEIVRQNIIKFRNEAGMSQADAADVSGVPNPLDGILSWP